jgi:hypothetical protein
VHAGPGGRGPQAGEEKARASERGELMPRSSRWLAGRMMSAFELPPGPVRVQLFTGTREKIMSEELPVGLPPLVTGLWRHWRGHLYQPLGYAQSAAREDEGRPDYRRLVGVVYVGLELQGAGPGPRMHFRIAVSDDPEVEAWWDYVHHDGSKCTHGREPDSIMSRVLSCSNGRPVTPRFTYVGLYYQEEDRGH